MTAGTELAGTAAVRAARWLTAVLRTARPRQWPKNLLVFAAPLAGASLGRDDGLGYALVAAVTFGCASAAVYFGNDAADAERDRRHPVKRLRPVASGLLPVPHAVGLAAALAVAALAGALAAGVPLLAAALAAYLLCSFAYSGWLKHVPVVEVIFVASGFLLRVLGGAAATHVPPSRAFLLVCSLGATGVAITKRCAELAALGPAAPRHRPVLRFYSPVALRAAQVAVAVAMLTAYVAWAAGERAGARPWHLASAVPLAVAVARFGVLAGRRSSAPVEDLLTRDGIMAGCELGWLALFVAGL